MSIPNLTCGTRPILTQKNRWCWVRLETKEALDVEGNVLEHFLSSEEYGFLISAKEPNGVYSLRDSGGHPHVTAFVENGKLIEIRGKMGAVPRMYPHANLALLTNLRVEPEIYDEFTPGLFGMAQVGGRLISIDEALVKISKNEGIDGNLDLSGYALPINLPNAVKVNGSIDLRECTSLINVPIFTGVDNLYLDGCVSLTTMPEKMKVGGMLSLRSCVALGKLPRGLKVGEQLDASHCTSLAAIGEGLEVGDNLFLNGCSSLANIPNGLKIGRNLDIRGCLLLTSMPGGLEVRGHIYGADHLPKSIGPRL